MSNLKTGNFFYNMAKIVILTADILSLRQSDITPGKEGVLMVQQDEVGMHQVALGERNEGVISIGFQPGQITKLMWTNMADVTLWTSQILTPIIVIPDPGQITDLDILLVDTGVVELQWTAPPGIPGEELTKADRYLIYLSQAEITNMSSLVGLKPFTGLMTPGLPGSLQTVIITNMPSSAKMYVAIVSEKSKLGKLRYSLRSNIVTFTTLPVEQVEVLSPSVRIPLVKDDIYDYRILYDFDAGHVDYTADSLADVSTITYDELGNPEGIIPRTVKTLSWGRLQSWYNENSNKIFIELDGPYDIEYVWFRTSDAAKGQFRFSTSLDGANYNIACDLPGNTRQLAQWNKHFFTPEVSQGVSYVMLEVFDPEVELYGMMLYGNRVQKPVLKGKKYKRNVPVRTLNQLMGLNGFLQEGDMPKIFQAGTVMRWYNEFPWLIDNVKGLSPESTGSGQGAVLSDMKFAFSQSHMWDYDAKLTLAKSLGIESLFCISHNPHFLRPSGYEHAMDSKPVDYGLNTSDLAITTNPFNYTFYARHGYNMAARYGNNPSVDQSYITLVGTETMKVGLNLVKYFEYGNEQDRFWGGANAYNNPQEFAARTSAVADGHKGLMGPGFGVKAADPTAKVVLGGLSGPNPSFVRQMMKWWDVARGPGDYPIDAINFHQYNSYKAEPDVPVYSSVPQYGIPPEDPLCGFKDMVRKFVKLRDEKMPNAEIWLTEVGYDEHWGGVNSPNSTSLVTRQKFKSYWLLRTHLLCRMLGIDVVNIYWYANTQVRIEDISQTEWKRDIFITSGIVDGVSAYNDWENRKALPAHYYLGSFRAEFNGYKYIHPIKEDGVNLVGSVVMGSANPNTYACAYGKDNGDKCIVAWLAGWSFATEVTKVYIDATESSVTMVRFENSEVRKDYAGVTTVLGVQSDEIGRYVNVTLSECPVVIKTKNIGIPKLLDPMDVSIAATSTSTLRLAWVDRNIGTNDTKIFHSLAPNSGFALISDSYIDNGQFDLSNLDEGSTHYFKVQFQLGSSISSLSSAIGVTLPQEIPVPTNLHVGAVTPSSLQLLWDYADSSLIDSFNIFKSNDVLGEFALVKTVAAADRSWVDNGLVESTTYYYKIAAKKVYDTSVRTLATGMTTDAATLQPPSVVDAVASFSGQRISIKFDVDMSNPASSYTSLSIIEDAAGTPVLRNLASLSLDPLNPRIIRGVIAGDPMVKNKTLHLSYDSGQGFINSAYNVNINPITNQVVTNRTGDPALIEQTIKVNYSLTGAPGDIPAQFNWNNILPISSPANASIYYKDLINSDGIATGYKFFQYEGGGYAGFAIEDNSYQLGPQYDTDAIQDLFPEMARRGSQMSWNTASVKMAGFGNLPPGKEFNIRFYADRGGPNTTLRYRPFRSAAAFDSVTIGTGVFARPALLGLKPSTQTISPVSNKGFNLNTALDVADYTLATTFKTAPMVGFEWSNGSDVLNRVMVTAFMLEQVANEME